MKLDLQIFHEFFYSGGNREQRGRANVHYTGRHFFSYNTEIGYLYNENGNPVLFAADYRFSATTAAHISALVNAAPVDVIYVPFDWNDNFSYKEASFPAEMIERFQAQLTQYTVNDFSRVQNRRDFQTRYNNLTRFLEATGQQLPDMGRARLDTLYGLTEDTDENRRARRQIIRERSAKKQAERARILAAAGVDSIIALALTAYDATTRTDVKTRTAARDTITRAFPCCSLVWPDPADATSVKTSQGISVPRTTARRLLALWNAGRARVGMHCGPYAIRDIRPDFVQIGCHKIPVENLQELAAALN